MGLFSKKSKVSPEEQAAAQAAREAAEAREAERAATLGIEVACGPGRAQAERGRAGTALRASRGLAWLSRWLVRFCHVES